MPIRTPVKRPYFRRVDAAKAKIAAKIDRYIELHEKAAKNAADKGNSAPVEWLLSHAEILEDDGTYSRPISGSVDRPQGSNAAPGTSITIGFLAAPPPHQIAAVAIQERILDAEALTQSTCLICGTPIKRNGKTCASLTCTGAYGRQCALERASAESPHRHPSDSTTDTRTLEAERPMPDETQFDTELSAIEHTNTKQSADLSTPNKLVDEDLGCLIPGEDR